MIRLRALGTLDLRNASGNEVHSVLAQPKRTALLAYLALAAPAGYHRRDTLLALFWPELDAARARGALNTAIYHLRQSLGANLLVNRGDEEVAIEPGRLWSDVAAFEEALGEGRLEAALELYGGELLQGFFAAGAPAFERWLEARRGELRGKAREAARALAERGEAAGALDEAVRWARRGLSLAPTDEPAARRLIALLDRSGDRAGALREYEEFAARLHGELEMEPTADTRALVEGIRAGAPRGETVVVPPAAPGATAEAEPARAAHPAPPPPVAHPATAPMPPRPASRGLAGALRGRTRLAAGALLVAALAVVTWGWLDGRDARADAADTTVGVAVLPFTVRGDPALAYLGEGMVDLLSVKLSGAVGYRSVDPRALLSYVGTPPRGGVDPARARRVAGRFEAQYLVLGEVVQAGGQLQLTASVYEREADGGPLSRAAVAGSVDSLPALVDQLAQQLIDRLPAGGGAGDALSRRAVVTTRSLDATRAFLEGERDFRAGRYARAAESFRRAVQADTGFALGYYRWSVAANWAGAGEVVGPAADAALRHERHVPERDRLLLRGWHLQQIGAAQEAERVYRSVIARHPEDVEAWNQLGEVLFHWNSSQGRPVHEARPAFEHVVLFEPHNTAALIHLARIAGSEGRFAAMDSLAARALAQHPDERSARELRALRAFGREDGAAREAFGGELRFLTGDEPHLLLRAIVAHTDNLAGAAELARTLIAREPRGVSLGYGLAAEEVEAARGRWREAERALGGLGLGSGPRAAEFRAAFAALPARTVPPGELRRLRDALPHPASGPVPIGPSSDFIGTQSLYPPRALYLRGVLSARAGEVAAAAGYADELDRFTSGNYRDDAYAGDYARTLRAQLALQGGDARGALSRLGAPDVPVDSLFPDLTSYPRAHARWVRAEALRALGRDRQALQVYASFPDPVAYDVMYVPLAHLRRGQLHERLGERPPAAREYARALAAWRDADAELRPLVDSARTGLARVSGS